MLLNVRVVGNSAVILPLIACEFFGVARHKIGGRGIPMLYKKNRY